MQNTRFDNNLINKGVSHYAAHPDRLSVWKYVQYVYKSKLNCTWKRTKSLKGLRALFFDYSFSKKDSKSKINFNEYKLASSLWMTYCAEYNK